MCGLSPALLLTMLIGQITALAPPADPRSPQRVLSDAGLTPLSNSYVLGGELEAIQTVAWIRQAEERLARVRSKIAPLEDRYFTAKRESDPLHSRASSLSREADELRRDRDEYGRPKKEAEADRLDRDAKDLRREAEGPDRRMAEAEREAAPLFRERDATTQEIQRLQFSYHELVADTLRRYAVVATDPRVKAALRTLNKGRRPKLALGPREAYQQNVVRASLETLAAIGLREERGSYVLPEEAKFIERVAAADLIRREVGMHERRLRDLQAPPGTEGSDPGSPPPPGRTGAAPPATGGLPPGAAAGAPAATKTQAARTPAEEAQRITGFLTDRRATFAQRVPDLRRQADEILAREQALAQDVEVRDSLEAINAVRRVKVGLVAMPGFPGSGSAFRNSRRWRPRSGPDRFPRIARGRPRRSARLSDRRRHPGARPRRVWRGIGPAGVAVPSVRGHPRAMPTRMPRIFAASRR